MRRALIASLMLLAGCGALRPRPPVLVPVREACTPRDFPPAPQTYADDALPTAPEAAAERYRQIAAANAQRKARLALVEPVIAACR